MGNLQLRRGPSTDRTAITPLAGEPIFDTTLNQLFVGNGSTVGGVAVGGGTGTVTSVGLLTTLSGLSTSGSPITTAGTITLSGTLGIASGGTGQTTANGALNALLPAQSGQVGKVLSTDGTNTSWINVSGGGASGVSGSLALAYAVAL